MVKVISSLKSYEHNIKIVENIVKQRNNNSLIKKTEKHNKISDLGSIKNIKLMLKSFERIGMWSKNALNFVIILVF